MALFATVAMVMACMFGRLSLCVFVRVQYARATDDDGDERRMRTRPRAYPSDESACMDKQYASRASIHMA